MTEQSPLTASAFTPSASDTESLLAWFARYDAHASRNEIDAMADLALFPITVTTNDSAGDCVTQVWDRDTFVRAMSANDPGSVELTNVRRPFFLNRDLAVVVTDSAVTTGGQTHHMRYADVLAKSGGEWRFTSMVQAGWGDMLTQYFGA